MSAPASWNSSLCRSAPTRPPRGIAKRSSPDGRRARRAARVFGAGKTRRPAALTPAASTATPSAGSKPSAASAPDIGPGLLELVAVPQRAEHLQRQHDYDAQRCDPDEDHEGREELDGDLVAAVEGAVPPGLVGVAEEPERQKAPDAASAVDGEGVHDVVHLELPQQHRGPLVHQAADEADNDGLPRLHEPAARGDRDEAGEDAVAKAADVQEPRRDDLRAQEEDQQAGHARGQRRVHSDEAGGVAILFRVHPQGAARVEAVPTEPQKESAQDAERDAVALELLLLL
eukprot:CAMPEP_0170289050 /NCGR_PEP_ID=MMETSP0116_2-20130129/44586_1 /TAXON_ID=400756 /ORGANISM="Durinskia baltica, Strain CSIRO CS-38" /LENGTH=286 /DNA_ID=CAMNT_0010540475 /DNA_START=46 /DNA_END=904 /DNA_ORIENTATION=+